MHRTLSRRDFISTAATLATATALLPAAARAAAVPPTRWPIGCFNRPFRDSSFDEALDGIKAAGYQWTGLLTASKDNPLIGSAATPEYLAKLKQQIAARGLKVNMGTLRVKNNVPLADAIADTRQQIENARAVGVEFVLTFGAGRPQDYAQYFKVMADAAAFAHERKIKLVMKPHGGSSGAAEEIRNTMKAVGHANFKVWYDAGNIVFYTGKDPVAELEPIAEHVTGLCAKDCDRQRGEVMIQLGAGKVDFAGVFKKLKAAGFNGPIMLEGCKVGPTLAETIEHARANRVYLEKVLASV